MPEAHCASLFAGEGGPRTHADALAPHPQEEVHSPAMRFREYTPTLTSDMSAARMARGAGPGAGLQGGAPDAFPAPQPMIGNAGDLFALPPPASQQQHAAASQEQPLQQQVSAGPRAGAASAAWAPA